MTSFLDVQRATCQVLADDGSHRGTAFLILPHQPDESHGRDELAGYLLTCHHVVLGLGHPRIKFPDDNESRKAELIEEYTSPTSDFAVLGIPGGA